MPRDPTPQKTGKGATLWKAVLYINSASFRPRLSNLCTLLAWANQREEGRGRVAACKSTCWVDKLGVSSHVRQLPALKQDSPQDVG